MAIAGRYTPPKPPAEASVIGLDFSPILPPGLGLTAASVSAFTNTSPANPTADLTFGAVSTRGRLAWCSLSGGVEGTDYQIRWSGTDSQGNVWPRTVLLLCAQTS